MKRRREQRGHVYPEHGKYFVRYRDSRVIAGELKRVRLRKELGPVDGMTKGQARERAKEILARVNKPRLSPETAVRLVEFVETVRFPRIPQRLRPSTVSGYRVLWRQLKPFCDRLWIRDVRTKHVQDVLDGLTRTERFNVNSLRHIKSFLSGVFKLALQQGFYEGPNPVRETTISGVRPATETHAYTLEEIEAMIEALPEPASTVIMTAALTGVRRGELRGMFWENYRNDEMLIVRSVWRSHVTEPKRSGSKKPIPIITLLGARLDAHRARIGNATSGPIFANEAGRPMELNNLLNRTILPALRSAGIQWHGWHGFRRGLGTNLHRLGVPDKTIQAILRHANVTTTMDIYVKSVSEDEKAAMAKLEGSLMARNWPGFSARPAKDTLLN